LVNNEQDNAYYAVYSVPNNNSWKYPWPSIHSVGESNQYNNDLKYCDNSSSLDLIVV